MLEHETRALHEALTKTLETQHNSITKCVEMMSSCLQVGGKILVCGNGGSASQAQHFSAELVVRFKENRKALASIALNTDSSILTACGNDFSFHDIFARQVEALASNKDVLLCLSTSGNSPNVVKAAEKAKALGTKVIAFTGQKDSALESHANTVIKVQSLETSRIQEIHLFLIHHCADVLESSS